jgi:CRISPR-associated protein Cas2
MRYVVVYDITPARIRTRLAKLLDGWGERVQLSVYECELEQKELPGLVSQISRTLETRDAGTVRLYRLCGDCIGASMVVGDIPPSSEDDSCMIFD